MGETHEKMKDLFALVNVWNFSTKCCPFFFGWSESLLSLGSDGQGLDDVSSVTVSSV